TVGGARTECRSVGIPEKLAVRALRGDVRITLRGDCKEARFHLRLVRGRKLVACSAVQDAVGIDRRYSWKVGRTGVAKRKDHGLRRNEKTKWEPTASAQKSESIFGTHDA